SRPRGRAGPRGRPAAGVGAHAGGRTRRRGRLPLPGRQAEAPARLAGGMEPVGASTPRDDAARTSGRVGFVSLGCPKALVDSERILSQLRADGYELVSSYEDAE